MTWRALRAELAAWRAEGRSASFWWRDDDAAAVTPALERLLALSRASGAPVALAVPPALARAELGEVGAPLLQHGYAHRNHAPPGERKAEYGAHRPLDVMVDEIADGQRRMRELFGAAFRPIFVPPWNRLAPALRDRLGALGFAGLSAYGPRRSDDEANAHCDLMLWRPERRFAGPEKPVAELVAHLAGRRKALLPQEEPTGVMSHHLAHDEAAWDFLARLLDEISVCDGAHWLTVDEIFRLSR